MESKRQLQVAVEIQKALNFVFQKHGSHIYGASFVTISGVKVTPDLLVARVYISILQNTERLSVMENLQQQQAYIRGLLGKQVGKQLRRVPDIEFFLDDSLDEVFKIEKLLSGLAPEKKDRLDD